MEVRHGLAVVHLFGVCVLCTRNRECTSNRPLYPPTHAHGLSGITYTHSHTHLEIHYLCVSVCVF